MTFASGVNAHKLLTVMPMVIRIHVALVEELVVVTAFGRSPCAVGGLATVSAHSTSCISVLSTFTDESVLILRAVDVRGVLITRLHVRGIRRLEGEANAVVTAAMMAIVGTTHSSCVDKARALDTLV